MHGKLWLFGTVLPWAGLMLMHVHVLHCLCQCRSNVVCSWPVVCDANLTALIASCSACDILSCSLSRPILDSDGQSFWLYLVVTCILQITSHCSVRPRHCVGSKSFVPWEAGLVLWAAASAKAKGRTTGGGTRRRMMSRMVRDAAVR